MENTIRENLKSSIHTRLCSDYKASVQVNSLHEQTVEDLFPSSLVAEQTTTLG